MEKQDLSKILISETEFYNKNTSSAKFFEKYGITTVAQLLDSNVLEGKRHVQGTTIGQVQLLINVLKCKYLGEPLQLPSQVDEIIDYDYMKSQSYTRAIYLEETEEERQKYLKKFCKTPYALEKYGNEKFKIAQLFSYINCTGQDYEYVVKAVLIGVHHGLIPKGTKLIDVLRNYASYSTYAVNKKVITFFDLYVKEYDKQKGIVEEVENAPEDGSTISDETMNYLRIKLSILMNQRNQLDEEIANVKEELEQLEKEKDDITR